MPNHYRLLCWLTWILWSGMGKKKASILISQSPELFNDIDNNKCLFVARTRCLNLVFLKKCLVMYCKTLVSIQNRSGQLCAIFVCCSLVCFSHAHVNWLFLPKMCLQLYNYSVVKKMLSSVTVLNHPPPPPAAPYYPRCVIWAFWMLFQL